MQNNISYIYYFDLWVKSERICDIHPRSGKAPFAGHKGIHSKLFQMFL